MNHGAPDPPPPHPRPCGPAEPVMTPAALVEVLRWMFWGLVYLLTITVGILAFAEVPAPPAVRLSMLAVVLFGVGVDIQHKRRADAERA